MRLTIPTIMLAAMLIAAGTASAQNIITVPGDYPTIGEALANAYHFTEVHVDPGYYPEQDLAIPAGVTLKGTGVLPRDVVIDAQGQGRVILATELCWIENLMITGGTADQGGGIAVLDQLTYLADVVIQDCTANLGAGILARTGHVELTRCELVGNAATTAGGGLYALDAGSLILRDSVFFENTAGGYGGAWSAARCQVTMEGCTVVGNAAALGAEGVAFDGQGVAITRTISSANAPDDGFEYIESVLLSDLTGRAANECSLRWQDGWTGWPGYLGDQLDDPAAMNLETDPHFCHEPGELINWLGLAADSPCLPQHSGGCDLIGAYGQMCGPTDTPDTPAAAFALNPAYPNPFNPQTTISYSLERNGPVTLVIYGLDGRRVATLVNEGQAAGAHTATWAGLDDRGRSVASGVYLCRLVSDRQSAAIRMTLVK